jgi:hypothetical protein
MTIAALETQPDGVVLLNNVQSRLQLCEFMADITAFPEFDKARQRSAFQDSVRPAN